MNNIITDKRMKQFDREYAVFPMEYINATQYADVGTHKGQLAIDFAGRDAGSEGFYAPFKLKILKTYPTNLGNAILVGSCDNNGKQKAVRCADGKDRVLTLLLIHSNTPQTWYENHRRKGTIFKQGDRVYGEGTAGFATGNHVHMEVATGWHYDMYLTGIGKYYGLRNPIRQDYVFHFLNGWNHYTNKRTERDFPLSKINVNGWNNKPSHNKPNFKGYKVGDLIEFSTMHKSHHEDPIVNSAPKNHLGRQVGYVIHLYPKDKYPLAVSKTKGGSQMGGVNPINVYRKNNNDILKGVNSPEQPKIKPKGQFKFKLDIDTRIRNGESGLAGKDTGLVYKDGMTVYYDKVYQKDGYTWISYISHTGVRRSVAVGKGNQIWGKNI